MSDVDPTVPRTYVPVTLVCRTEGCRNEGLHIDVQMVEGSTVAICGACGNLIGDQRR